MLSRRHRPTNNLTRYLMNVKKMKFGLCLALMGVSPTLFAQTPFEIKGKVDGMTADSVVLFKMVNNKEQLWLKTKMANGEFSFKGTVSSPELCMVRLGTHKYPIKPFFIDGGTTTYQCGFDKEKGRPLVPTITGNETQDQLNAYEKGKKEFSVALSELNTKMRNEKDKLTEEQKKGIEAKMDSIYNAMDSYSKQSITTYASSVVSPYIVKSEFIYGASTAELKGYLNLYPAEVKKSSIAQEIADHVSRLEKVDVGAKFPNIKLNTLEGKEFELASLKGKVFVIDFWASWCGPCRKENPNMVKLYNDFHPKGLEMIGISLDKSFEPWKVAVEKDGLTWMHISDLKYWQSEAAKLYVVMSVPTTILIGKDGKIVARGLHGEELRNAVEKLLKM